jgi:hypothetical protein
MTRKVLITLLLSLAALPAVAGDWAPIFGQPLPLVAQMSQEDRRALRERWEHASPEERAQLRRFFQERMRRMPGEPYATRGMEMGERMMNPWRDEGYGTGYELRRQDEDERSDRQYEDRYDERRDDRGEGRRNRGRR